MGKEEGIFFLGEDKYVIYDVKSLYLFHYRSRFRKAIVWFTEWK